MASESEKEELKAVAEFIKELSNIVPNMVKGILESFFSEEAGRSMGKAVGNFYNELIKSGIPPQTAVEMAKDYLGTLTKWSDVLKTLQIHAPTRKETKEVEVCKEEPGEEE
ncbi:MAG: hypothetical protein QXM89_02145 [Candidatus Bathyarchaeia archaeon]